MPPMVHTYSKVSFPAPKLSSFLVLLNPSHSRGVAIIGQLGEGASYVLNLTEN